MPLSQRGAPSNSAGGVTRGVFPVVPPAALDVSDQLQLFLDEWLIESLDNVRQILHSPQPREVVIEADRPYEDGLMYDPVVIKEGARYRMWYRTNYYSLPPHTGYAESADGIHWTKPDLGLIEYQGSRANNLVWPIPGGAGGALCQSLGMKTGRRSLRSVTRPLAGNLPWEARSGPAFMPWFLPMVCAGVCASLSL